MFPLAASGIPNSNSPARVTSAVNRVCEYLRANIVRGELLPGTWLRPDEIAEELGVSRMPIREALQRLEAESYVVCHAHRGWTVASLTADDVEELYLMRGALQGLATRLAAPLLTDDDLSRMEALLCRMRELRSVSDVMVFLYRDWEFHDVLYAAAKRPRLYQRIHALRQNAARYARLYITLPGATDVSIAAHCRILDACRSRDPESVERADCEHSAETARLVIEYIRTHPTPG